MKEITMTENDCILLSTALKYAKGKYKSLLPGSSVNLVHTDDAGDIETPDYKKMLTATSNMMMIEQISIFEKTLAFPERQKNDTAKSAVFISDVVDDAEGDEYCMTLSWDDSPCSMPALMLQAVYMAHIGLNVDKAARNLLRRLV